MPKDLQPIKFNIRKKKRITKVETLKKTCVFFFFFK